MTNNFLPNLRSVPCILTVLMFFLPVISWPQQATELLPDLQAFPAYDIELKENFGGVVELRFSVRTWNSGAGALELIAGDVAQGQQSVWQRVYDDQGTYQEYLAGNFVWHQGHDHFHFEDYARYTLQAARGGSKRNSIKTSFCLMDTELVDGQLPGAPNHSMYENCGNFFQGISVGWADVYGSDLPGQSIALSKLKDGNYRLIIEADPKNRILETDDDNNSACVLLNISVTAQTVDVLNPDNCDETSEPPPGGEIIVAGITPNAAVIGETVEVIIDGSGFSTGADVRFVNGNGSKPVASNMQVISPTQINASVTVKKRGKTSDNLWDLMIGSAILQDAFTVLP